MDYRVLPPEINSARLFVGVGAEPMVNAAAAWQSLATDLGSAAASFSSVTSDLAGTAWRGPASAVMANAAAHYIEWLSTATMKAEQAASQMLVTAAAFEVALVATVRPSVISANRYTFESLVLSNVLGQNGPAIAATS